MNLKQPHLFEVNRIFPVLLLFIFTTNLLSQWEIKNQIANEYGPPLNKISFLDQEFGMASGEEGLIYISKDKGESWDKLNIGSESDISDLQIFNRENIFLITENKLLKSTNEGATWNELYVFQQEEFLESVFFTNEVEGFIVSDHNLYKTIDGGLKWEKVWVTEFQIIQVVLVNDEVGFILTYFYGGLTNQVGHVYKTTNSGESWSKQQIFQGNNSPLEIQFVNETTGYLVINSGAAENVIYNTIDQGDSWVMHASSLGAVVEGSYFNLNYSYIVELTAIGVYPPPYYVSFGKKKNTDVEFVYSSTNTNLLHRDVWFTTDSVGYIVGDDGLILKTETCGGDLISSSNDELNPSNIEVFPNPFSEYISVSCEERLKSTTLYNNQGKVQFHENDFNFNFTSLDTKLLSPGIYYLVHTTKSGLSTTQKIVKQEK